MIYIWKKNLPRNNELIWKIFMIECSKKFIFYLWEKFNKSYKMKMKNEIVLNIWENFFFKNKITNTLNKKI